MSDLTPDLLQWLVVDEKVVTRLSFCQTYTAFQVSSKWKHFAHHLGLSEYISYINRSELRRRGVGESEKMELLMRMWKEKKPDTFTIKRLLTILALEVRNRISYVPLNKFCFIRE